MNYKEKNKSTEKILLKLSLFLVLGVIFICVITSKSFGESIKITGPQKMEYDPEIFGNVWSKKIVIYQTDSQDRYNIFVYTDISNNLDDIELFRYLDDSTMIRVTGNPDYDLKFIDTNGDSNIDGISWTIPELKKFGRIIFSVEGKFASKEETKIIKPSTTTQSPAIDVSILNETTTTISKPSIDVSISNNTITTTILSPAIDVNVKNITNVTEETLINETTKVLKDLIPKDAFEITVNKSVKGGKLVTENIEKIIFYHTSSLSQNKQEEAEINKPVKWNMKVESENDEYIINYKTSAPWKDEEVNIEKGKLIKNIKISSNSSVHYTNVKSYTDLLEPTYNPRLFWFDNGNRVDVTNDPRFDVKLLDTNNNSYIDRIEWIVPHLSEQEFEVEADIIIINVQSYPVVGGNWSVRFNTTGTANLTVTAIPDTSFTEIPDNPMTPDDLEFLEMRCGEEKINVEKIMDGNKLLSIFYPDYYCDNTSYFTSKVLTSGKHKLEFKFGNQVAYAYNLAGCTGTDVSPCHKCDVDNMTVTLMYPNGTTVSEYQMSYSSSSGSCTSKSSYVNETWTYNLGYTTCDVEGTYKAFLNVHSEGDSYAWEVMPKNYSLDASGYPLHWLMLGTFAVSACDDISGNAINPSTTSPSDGESEGGETWFTAEDADGNYDWNLIFGSLTSVYGYAHLYVYSSSSQTVRLSFGSDDAMRIWVNGVSVYNVTTCQGTVCNQWTTDVSFNAGWNRVLIAVTEGGGGWGHCLRFLDTSNNPLSLTYTLSNSEKEYVDLYTVTYDTDSNWCTCGSYTWLSAGTGTGSDCCGDDTGEDWEQTEADTRSCCYNAVELTDETSSGSILCHDGQLYDCNSQVSIDGGVDTESSTGDRVNVHYCDDDNTWKSAIPILIINNGTDSINNSGLVGYWRLEEGSASPEDYSGYGNDGTLGGGLDCSGNVGRFGYACDFDGLNDYIEVVESPNLDFSRVDNYTITLWAYVKPLDTYQQLITKGLGTRYPYKFEISNTNQLYASTYNGSASGSGLVSFKTISTEEWVHLVFVKDGDTVYGYLNGGLSDSNDFPPGEVSNDVNIFIGSREGPSCYFNGTIDEVMIWNRALSASEISMLYESTRPYGSTISYSETNIDDTDLTYNFYRNLTSISSPDTSSPGYSYYIINTTGGQNYTQSSFMIPVNVSQQSTTCSLSFSPASAITYETQTTASCACTGGATAILWRNNTDVTATENNSALTLPSGVWDYVCNQSDAENYTMTPDSSTYTVNKAKPTLILSNNTASVNTSGLVGYWRFENDVIDYSGYSNDGSVVNTPTYQTGRFENAKNFTGLSDRVMKNDTNLDGMDNLTVAAWIYPSTDWTTSHGIIATHYVAADAQQPYLFGYYPEYNDTSMRINNDGSEISAGLNTVPHGQWTFLVYTWDSSTTTAKIYVNGKVNKTDTTTFSGIIEDNSNNFTIGSRPDGTAELFKGLIDEVMIFNKVLTANEIAELYESRVTYGTATTFTGSNCPEQLTCNFYRNLTDKKTAENGTSLTIDAGYHYYLFNTSGNANYTRSTILLPLNISKSTPQLSLSSSPSWSETYKETVVTGSETNSGDGNCNYKLYRNDSYIGSQETITLPVGDWNYTYNTSGCENYTSNETANILAISQATATCTFYLNGTTDDKSYNKGEIANLTGYVNTAYGVTIYLNMNATGYGNDFTSDTDSSVENLTDTDVLSLESYNATTHFAGDENYTSCSDMSYLTSQDTTPPLWNDTSGYLGSNTSIPSQGNPILLYGMGYDNVALDWAWLATNETGEWKNYTEMTEEQYGNLFFIYSSSGNSLDDADNAICNKFTIGKTGDITNVYIDVSSEIGVSPEYRYGLKTAYDGDFVAYENKTITDAGDVNATLNGSVSVTKGNVMYLCVEPSGTPYYPNSTDYIEIPINTPANDIVPIDGSIDNNYAVWIYSTSWSEFTTGTPQYILEYSDYSREGQPYRSSGGTWVYGSIIKGENFTIEEGDKIVRKISVYTSKNGNPQDNLTAEIRDQNNNILTSCMIIDNETVSATKTMYTCDFGEDITLVNGSSYIYVMSSYGSTEWQNCYSSPYMDTRTGQGGTSYNGTTDFYVSSSENGSSWSSSITTDVYFNFTVQDKIHKSPLDTADAAATWTWSNFTWSNSSVSAGTIIGWKIYYNDTSSNENVTSIQSFTINSPPEINFVKSGLSATPTEATTTEVIVEMHVTDPDGETNIDDSKVNMTFYKSAETNRTDSLCTPSATGTTSTMQNFTCTMTMQYFDGNGAWTIYGYASDINDYSVINATVTMTYNTLEAWNYTPSSITFGTTLNLGDINTLATDDPVIFYNRGNYDLSARMQIKGIDLKGTTTPSYTIGAGNFSVNVADACDSGNTFTNNTDANITSFSLAKGVTLENIYLCLETVPAAGITAQAYSATGDGTWNLNSD